MTLLDRLARKNIVTRRKVGRAFFYASQVSQDSVRRMAFQEFLESYFDGSAVGLIEFLGDAQARPPVARAATAAASGSIDRLDTALL
jgi:predicted transcriptional regulator